MDLSLRKNKALRANTHKTNPYANLPSIAKKDQEKIGKLMQRRMSIHHEAKFVPGEMPPLPSNVNTTTTIQDQKPPAKKLDLQDPSIIQMLTDPNFKPHDFIVSKLGDSTASDIDKFNSNLTSLNKKIQNDIKISSNQTYDKLITTTSELSKTNDELKFLRNCINELLEISNDMKLNAEKKIQIELNQSAPSNNHKSAKDRSSILVLEKMWSNEMQSLFKHVEGAQKFIAPIPGRHVLVESGRWYELNSATFKILQPAHIFLLNDLLLIATRKRKSNNIKNDIKSLVADQCWPLREIQFVEMKSQSNEQKFMINIKYNSQSYIYQTDRIDHYNKIINGFKKAKNELRDISEAENIKQKQLRDSMTLLSLDEKRHNNKRNSNVLLQDLSTRMHSRSRSMDNSNTLRNLKKIDDLVDELDVLIFHENFEDSLIKLNELESDLLDQQKNCNDEELLFFNIIKLKISTKKDTITKTIINSIKSKNLSLSELSVSISLLNKLNLTEISKLLYLNNRSQTIIELISKIEESGTGSGSSIIDYITTSTIITIQSLKTSFTLYKTLFPSSSANISQLVHWGITEIQTHIHNMGNLLQDAKFNKKIIQNGILIWERQVEDLKISGLDVAYLFDEFYASIEAN